MAKSDSTSTPNPSKTGDDPQARDERLSTSPSDPANTDAADRPARDAESQAQDGNTQQQ